MGFGSWLLGQRERDDWVGSLAQQAARDPAFPRGGDPEAVGRHLGARGADADAMAALDHAEAEWLRAY